MNRKPEYESVMDFSATGSRRGLLDPPTMNGEIIQARNPTHDAGRGGRPATPATEVPIGNQPPHERPEPGGRARMRAAARERPAPNQQDPPTPGALAVRRRLRALRLALRGAA